MRRLFSLFLICMICSCQNEKLNKLESEVIEIKQSLLRIEQLLGNGENLKSSPSHATKDVIKASDNRDKLPQKNSAAAGRCQAITKKGSQCSRKARSGGYCWQHGG